MSAEAKGPPKRVLLIAREEADYRGIQELLKKVPWQSYELNWERTFAGGRGLALSRAFDVALIDQDLDERNGLELTEELLGNQVAFPLIVLTHEGDHALDLEAMSAGAADHLVKGLITSHLLERSIRYSIKQFADLKMLRERETHIIHQDRLASIGLLASGLAHEIGTPLGVIRGRAEYLAMLANDSEQMKKGLDIIVAQIDRIAKLIYSLLTLAREDKTIAVTNVKVEDVVERVLGLLGHKFKVGNIQVHSRIPEGALVRAEVEPLEQVMLNLMINAVHAIESAIKSGRTQGHRIDIVMEPVEKFWQLSVTDTGCGISEANREHIFRPFFTTKEVGVGTGLGLATSNRIIHSWGGSIRLESQEGVGTTFRILIPAAG